MIGPYWVLTDYSRSSGLEGLWGQFVYFAARSFVVDEIPSRLERLHDRPEPGRRPRMPQRLMILDGWKPARYCF